MSVLLNSFRLQKVDDINNHALEVAQDAALGRLVGDKFSGSPSLSSVAGAYVGQFTLPQRETVTYAHGKIHIEKHTHGFKVTRLSHNSSNPFAFNTWSISYKYDKTPTTTSSYFEREYITSKLTGWKY